MSKNHRNYGWKFVFCARFIRAWKAFTASRTRQCPNIDTALENDPLRVSAVTALL